MWERLIEFLSRLGFEVGDPAKEKGKETESQHDPNIEFRSLDPKQAAALGLDTELVCPVTRKPLLKGTRFYVCRDCNTAYSVEGWDFLKQTDKGRCCNCRHIGSVVFHGGESAK
jgi:hypothetical protein